VPPDARAALHALEGGPPVPAAPRSDAGNAERLVTAHGADLRFVPGLAWLVWDGRRWRSDEDGEVLRRVRDVARRMLQDALALEDSEQRKAAAQFALRTEDGRRLRAAVELAAVDAAVIARVEQLDAHPFLLTACNGTVDLRTGRLAQARRGDLITKATPIRVDPKATCPRWERFLFEIFSGDLDLIEFVQRLAGYCLTGDTREHVLPVLHGAGCNGKSTFVAVLRQLLGEHSMTAPFDTFTRSRGDRGPRDDLARLRGARLVVASEGGQGSRLDEAVVKEITGGDTIAARHLYGRYFEFRPTFKILLVTNHRPRVDGDDEAIWRRLRLVPFEECFQGREDRSLDARLADELPGILNWALDGCLAWQRDGLGDAAAVARATGAYRAEEDHLGAFLAERTRAGGEVVAAELRAAYESWCGEIGERPVAGSVLGRQLARRGITAVRRTGGRRAYIGLTLAVTDDGNVNGFGNSSTPARVRGLSESAVTICHPSLGGEQ